MPVYFISDAHLGEIYPERENLKKKKLYDFFEMVNKPDNELYIVGDLFDFWFEYKHAIPKEHIDTILRLADLHRSGVKLYYITGNHDHWLGKFLSIQIGFTIYRDSVDIMLDDNKALVTHGDGITKTDWKYRILKRILRNKFNTSLYKLVPPDVGIPFAKYVSGKSRGHTQKRPKDSFINEYREYARKKLKAGYDVVIIAHTHVPEDIKYPEGQYINTGDWIENFTFAVYSDNKLVLKRWEDD